MITLPDAEDRIIVCSFIWTKHRNVTDGQTDKQISSGYYSGLHCKQCGRAVKIGFYRATAYNATHGTATKKPSVRPFLRSSVKIKRVEFDTTKETSAHILIV